MWTLASHHEREDCGSGSISSLGIQARTHDPIGNLLLSVVDKFGIARDSVGYSTGRVDL